LSVREREGQQQQSSIRQVLERIDGEAIAAAPMPPPPAAFYSLDKVITRRQHTGVTLLLATPLEIDNDADADTTTTTSIKSPCLVRCGPQVVIKAIPRARSKACIDDPLTEIAAIQELMKHDPKPPHVVRLLDVLKDADYYYLVQPYLEGGDLFSRVEVASSDGGIPEAEAASYLRQMARALCFLKESCGLAHHDVSLENVVRSNMGGGGLMLIDLGMCLQVPRAAGRDDYRSRPIIHITPQRCRGKPSFVSPEVVREEAFDPFAADIWSAGICL